MRTTVFLTLVFLLLHVNNLKAQQTIFINEIMASNDTTIADNGGNYNDWFEIYNSDSNPFDLTNYYVTDDISEPTKFQLSNLSVPANGYLILWPSGSNTDSIHLPFKLSASGEGVFIFAPDGTTLIDSVTFGQQKTDISYGRTTDGAATFGYFRQATPDASNNTSQTYLGFLDPPVFSTAAGFYADPFQLSITDGDSTAQIVYTTDGSIPDANNLNGKVYRYKNQYPQAGQLPFPFLYDSFKSQLYSQPLQIIDATNNPNRLCLKSSTYDKFVHYYPTTNINKATLVRAIAVKDGYISSAETASTYFVTPSGINHYTLPVISLGIEEDHMFNWDSGIYCAGMDYDNWRLSHPNAKQNGGTTANYRRDSEYPLTLEFFENGATSRKFGMNAGFQMHGDYSLARPQKSLNIYLRSKYGSPSDLNYQLFPDRPYQDYQRFILRNSGNDEGETRFRDMSIQAMISHMKLDTQDGKPSIVFIGGEYTGLLNIRTKYDQAYFAQVYGIEEDQLDYLESNAVANDGDNTDYLNLRNFIQSNDMTKAVNYDSVGKRMDIDNYIDYYISKIYFGCDDWPGNNIAYFRKRVPYTPDAPYGLDGRYRWLGQDYDSGLGFSDSASGNTLQLALGARTDLPRPTWSTVIFKKLTKNTNFRNSFVTRYCDLLNTTFLPARLISIITYYHDLIAPEMPEHIARWHNPGSLDKWNAYVNDMDTFAVQRPAYAFQHVQSNWSLSAKQQITLNVADTSAGFIHINTIDINSATPGVSQNPYPWNGYYFPNIPVTIIAVAKPGYRFLHWQGDNTSTKDTLSVSLTAAKSFTAIFQKVITPTEDLIDYWHFNNLPQPPVTLTSVNADSTATGNAVITYEGTGVGFMDYTDTSSTGYPFGKQEGSDVNIQLGQIPGNALRARNPSNTRYLLIKAPTTGFKDIKVKYATVRTNKGAQYQRVSYTTDDSTWILKQDSLLMPSPETVPFMLDSLNFSSDVNANNNSLFAIKIEFFGSQATGSSGNDRFDNITVSGNTITSCGIPYGLTATNITTDSATVSWDSVEGANSYDVDYKIDTATTWTNAATATTAFSVNLSALSPSTLYDFRVRSTCAYGPGDYDTSQFTTLSPPPCNIVYDGKAHNTFATAKSIPLSTNVNGTISSATDTDYYKFRIPVKETATVTLSTLPANYDLYIYNNAFKQIASSTNTDTISETNTRVYVTGNFYIKVASANGAYDTANCYTLNVTAGPAALMSESLANSVIADNSLHIFPNPVSSVLNVNTSAINDGEILKVVDVFGKTVLSQRVTSTNSRVNVSRLPGSVYLLVILNKNGNIISTSKFVKQ